MKISIAAPIFHGKQPDILDEAYFWGVHTGAELALAEGIIALPALFLASSDWIP
jgi:hypothetical protein